MALGAYRALRRRIRLAALVLACTVSAAAFGRPSSAKSSTSAADAGTPPLLPYSEPLPSDFAQAKAAKYARLSSGQCRAELRKRRIKTSGAGGRGVALPVRLAAPLRGVQYRAPGKKSVYGILDCRLVLVLDDLAGLLARHEVVSVHVDNMYRPRARLPGRRRPSQHAYGLAIDIAGFTLKDGRTLLVERDWHACVGSHPCGPDAELLVMSGAPLLLRNIVCDVAREGLFNHILTPSYDAAHRNHLHLDIKRDAREFTTR